MPERKKKPQLKSKGRKKVHSARRTAVKAKKATAVEAKKKHVAKTASAKANEVTVYDVKGKSVETMALDPMFQGAVHTGIVYQAILKYRAGEREGTAATKTRGEVSGGGKKPWKQKGTGQARHGSRRSPIWRGGGVVFGPHPKDYSYEIPQQLKRSAVAESIKDKVLNSRMFLLNKLELATPKTREVAEIFEALKLEKPVVVVDKKTTNLLLATRNIPGVSVKTADEVNALDVAEHKEILLTKSAYSGLVKRLKS
jgi:large subunit ribosomal protein L4